MPWLNGQTHKARALGLLLLNTSLLGGETKRKPHFFGFPGTLKKSYPSRVTEEQAYKSW